MLHVVTQCEYMISLRLGSKLHTGPAYIQYILVLIFFTVLAILVNLFNYILHQGYFTDTGEITSPGTSELISERYR